MRILTTPNPEQEGTHEDDRGDEDGPFGRGEGKGSGGTHEDDRGDEGGPFGTGE